MPLDQQPPQTLSTRDAVRILSEEPFEWSTREIAKYLDIATQAVYYHKKRIAEQVSA